MAGEGGESALDTNFNYFLEEYGMSVNGDAVARTLYYKYFHPKEVYVTNGILNREINRVAGKKNVENVLFASENTGFNPSTLTFVYPFGASLNIQKPAIPLLSSGTVSYPLNRPLAGITQPSASGGKVMAIGSGHIFSDAYLDKEENAKLFDVFLQLLSTSKITLNTIDANEPDVRNNSK
jgi:intraflagellar transport protein 52